jgi:hypothetical protein
MTTGTGMYFLFAHSANDIFAAQLSGQKFDHLATSDATLSAAWERGGDDSVLGNVLRLSGGKKFINVERGMTIVTIDQIFKPQELPTGISPKFKSEKLLVRSYI